MSVSAPVPVPAPVPVKPSPWLVEAKVIASTAAAALIGIAVTLLNEIPGNASLMGSVPGWLQGLITVAVPPLITFVTGWLTKHTPRPELGA